MIKNIEKTTSSIMIIIFAFVLAILGVVYIQPNNAYNVSAMDFQSDHKEYAGTDGSGSGNSEEDPILIGSYNTFNTIVRNRSLTQTTYFVLIKNIDLSPANTWTPFTQLAAPWVFDGNNYTIYNMKFYSGSQFGLFREIYGIVKNLRMGSINISKVTGSSVTRSGAIGYRAMNGAIFENVSLESGIILSTGAQIGGFVSLIDGGTVTFRNCYNKVPVESTYIAGGFVSQVTGVANVLFEKCANLASVASTSTSVNAQTGGFVGTVDNNSANLTFDFCYNLGDIQGFHELLGGFIGRVIRGTVTISNSFNDAEIVINNADSTIQTKKGAFATRSNGTVNITDSFFNETIFSGDAVLGGGNINNQPNMTTENLRSQSFVDMLNIVANEELFEFNNGVVGFAVLYQKYTLTFNPGEGVGEVYEMIRNKTDITTTLPYNGMLNYPGLPSKVGYVFNGWKENVTNVIYQAEDTFTNNDAKDITFVAQFQKGIYKVEFDDNTVGSPTVKDINGVTSFDFSIGNESGKFLDSGLWNVNYRWMIQLAGTSGASDLDWIVLSQTQQVNFTDLAPENETGFGFINSFVNYEGYEENALHSGEIRVKIADTSTNRLLNIISNNVDGGELTIVVLTTDLEEQIIRVPLGSVISLPTTGHISNITATTNNHYDFESIILYDDNNSPVGTPINSANYDSSEDNRFNLTTGLLSGYTLEMNFSKIEYEFRIYAALRDAEEIELDENLVIYNPADVSKISIYENAFVSVDALPESPSSNYRFVTFKLYNALENVYFNSDFGVYSYSKNYDSLDINEQWLETYLINNQVIIIAEYVEAYGVSIAMAEGQTEHGDITIKVVDALTLEVQYYSYMQNIYIVKNSIITIVANPEFIYEFDYFLNIDENDYVKDNEAIITVNQLIDIRAVFKYKSFTLEFAPIDQINYKVHSVSGLMSFVNGQENTSSQVKVTDELNGSLFNSGTEIIGYKFVNFTVKNELGENTPLTGNLIITEEIINKNLNKFNKFIIYANYISTHILTLTQPSENLGRVDVFIKGEETSTDAREFDYGTELVIIAHTNRFSKLDENNPIYGCSAQEKESDNKLNVTITYNRSIVFNFLPLTLNIDKKLISSNGGNTTISKINSLNIGDTITLIVNIDSGKELKDWKINGVSINNLPDNMAYEGNSVTITITEDWLNGLTWLDDNTFVIESNASFGMTIVVLMAIIIPSILIPLLSAVLILYYMNLNKRKARIKAELKHKQASRYRLNTSDFIKDLREGKDVGQVTDEDVKKAMKDKKKKK